MGSEDRRRWDERWAARPPVPVDELGAPAWLAAHEDRLPTAGHALELACGDGRTAVWLARRGLDVWALDVSPVAVAAARDLAARAGVPDRCRFDVADLDLGLPPGSPADVVVCHLFDAPDLAAALVDRLAPGGLLSVAVLSEVGAAPGRFRVRPGELLDRFGAVGLDLLDHAEAAGVASLLARRRPPAGGRA